MSLIPVWAKLGALAALVLLVASSIWGYGHHEYTKGKDEVRAEVEKKYAADLEKVRSEEAAKRNQVEVAHVDDVKRIAVQEATAVAAHDELGRLRAAVANRPARGPAATTGSSADATAVFRAVVAACAERYEDVAANAGRLTNQVIGLQAYVRAVLPPDQSEGRSPVVGEDHRGAVESPTQPTTAPSRFSLELGGAPKFGGGTL